MKIAQFLTPLVLLVLPLLASAQAPTITDGPYVFYRHGTGYVKSVVARDSAYGPAIDSFPEQKKDRQTLTIHVDRHPEWDFTVRLRRQIVSPPDTTDTHPRSPILVVSDIEGEFEHFRKLLLAAHVINKKYKWRFGKGKLVIAGDLFDRGNKVAQFLWLLYKLEDEAKSKGGEVHVILGNHDIMNLQGDFRYVRPEFLGNARLLTEPYAALYGRDTELGGWLRSKNTIEKINARLVLHGGISPELLRKQKKIPQINGSCRPWYDAPPSQISDSLRDFFNANALFWYRGYFLEPRARMTLVDSTLRFYHADQLIVGHDIIDHIAPSYDGKIMGVDVNEHEGTHEALLIARGKQYRIDDKGTRQELFSKQEISSKF